MGGPFNQRIDPALLTAARKELEREGVIKKRFSGGAPWYFLSGTPEQSVKKRLEELTLVHERTNDGLFKMRMGQTAEIAVFRAMTRQDRFGFLGGFADLEEHDDSRLYKREEPPSMINGKVLTKGKLDFIFQDRQVGNIGVELKNVRPWLFPQSAEVKECLRKCCELDVLPVLIARRIAYVTRSEIFTPCGVIVHEIYNQLYPDSDAELAALAKDKNLLGYFDIRIGNEPDDRLTKFLHENLPVLVERALPKFQEHKDLLYDYASGKMSYLDFYVELRTRRGLYGIPEDFYEDPDDGDV